jgi:hypothetical protein
LFHLDLPPFFNTYIIATTAAAGNNIAMTLLAIIPVSFSLVPGEEGNGFKMLGSG